MRQAAARGAILYKFAKIRGAGRTNGIINAKATASPASRMRHLILIVLRLSTATPGRWVYSTLGATELMTVAQTMTFVWVIADMLCTDGAAMEEGAVAGRCVSTQSLRAVVSALSDVLTALVVHWAIQAVPALFRPTIRARVLLTKRHVRPKWAATGVPAGAAALL